MSTGEPGPKGEQGMTGPKGDTGSEGAIGPVGPKGDPTVLLVDPLGSPPVIASCQTVEATTAELSSASNHLEGGGATCPAGTTVISCGH